MAFGCSNSLAPSWRTVVSESGKDDLTYTINIKRLRLADPLTALSVKGKADGSGAEYLTGFAGDNLTYSMEVENAVGTVKVTPTAAAGATAVVKLNGAVKSSGAVDLVAGWNNKVTIEVSQPVRTNRVYTVDIGRQPDWKQGFGNWPVETGKSWKVQFNNPADKTNASDNIYVTDAGGNRVQVELNRSADNKTVTVKPKQGYNPGASYTLQIKTALKSEQGTALKAEVNMPFTIKQ